MNFLDNSANLLTNKPQNHFDDANMIPLINVVFLLLVFFMVAGQITSQEPAPYSAPKATNEQQLKPDAIDVLISADKTLWLMQEQVSIEEFASRLAQENATGKIKPSQLIVIKADASLPASALDGVIKSLKNNGFMNIALMTELAE